MIISGTWTKSDKILRDLGALHWLHLAGMHQPMIQEMRHMKAPGRGIRIGRGYKGRTAMITPLARHWLHWADMHPQQRQYIKERLFLPALHGHSLVIITDHLMNPMPAVAPADTVKDPTYFRHRTHVKFRLHTSVTILNSDIALGSQHQLHPNQLQTTKELRLIVHRF